MYHHTQPVKTLKTFFMFGKPVVLSLKTQRGFVLLKLTLGPGCLHKAHVDPPAVPTEGQLEPPCLPDSLSCR
jgi:hypothetical protein